MKKSLLIGFFALAITGIEAQAQVGANDGSSVRTESTAEILRRGGGHDRGHDRGPGRGDRDRGGRGGRDWDHGRRHGGGWWPFPGHRDHDQYVCHARGNHSRMLYRGDGWSREAARSEALNRCYRSSGGCYITSCYRD